MGLFHCDNLELFSIWLFTNWRIKNWPAILTSFYLIMQRFQSLHIFFFTKKPFLKCEVQRKKMSNIDTTIGWEKNTNFVFSNLNITYRQKTVFTMSAKWAERGRKIKQRISSCKYALVFLNLKPKQTSSEWKPDFWCN